MTPGVSEPVDIIVIGAGSAGAVVAARASEDPNRTVLLLEAGPDYADTSATPFDVVNSHKNSEVDHDWGLSYQPTQRGGSRTFPRGRVTGGSSAVNTTIALRGMPEDYDGWADTAGSEWSWANVLPAFNRLERDLDFGDKPYHGDAGPITIRRYPAHEMTLAHQAFLEAAHDLGYPDCPDANDPWSWGSGPHPMNKIGRVRVSTAVGYLAPARIRPNLTVRSTTTVRRLLIENGVCTGVEVETNGQVESLRARLVVLSAGAIQSPAIVMRSGVGKREELEPLGIEVLRDAPAVGDNLSDHPALAVLCRVKDPSILDADQPIVQTILRYTAPGSEHRNDLQIEQFSFSPRGGPLDCFAIAAVLEHAYGTGRVRITSADPHALPVTEQRFCEDERDRARLRQCFRDTVAFTYAKPLSDLIDTVLFPDPDRALDDDALDNLILRLSASGFHPCATLRMGRQGDSSAFVDQFGRAFAVERLVVADASIMPTVPRANTNLTSIMIGEKIGDWIRTNPSGYGL